MREIKFKVWNKRFRMMWSYPDFSLDRILRDYEENYFDDILIQYTGLKDKNGKEIYEGDILAHCSYLENKRHGSPKDDFSGVVEGFKGINTNPYPIHRHFQDFPYTEVKYVDGSEGYRERACYSPLYDYPSEDFEIVGNIYENPELITRSI